MSRFASRINEPVFDDRNIDSLDWMGVSRGYETRDWQSEPFGASGAAVPLTIPLIPRSEWRERIEEIEKSGSLLSVTARNAGVKTKHQNGTNYCWANGPALAVEILEVLQGRPYTELSPASVAGPITGYRNVGGWGTKALAYMREHGICPSSLWPSNSIDRRHDNPQSRAAREAHKPTEWADVEPGNFDALMTCLILQRPAPVAYNRLRHLMCAVDPIVFSDGGYGVRIWNSHGEASGERGMLVFRERLATPDECVCPMVALA